MREPIQIVEIDQDKCSLSYGTAPCEAAIGITGARKCFNTFKTCQDTVNYTLGDPVTLRFAKSNQSINDIPVYVIPSLVSASSAPTVLNIGGGDDNSGALGKRASVKIVMQDLPHSDNFVDPYPESRLYDPVKRGTFWTKWLARNAHYVNRSLRIRDGYVGQALEDMSVRHYIIDSIVGVDSSGKVTITAKDVLKLADDKQAKAPKAQAAELLSAITNSQTTIILRNAVLAEYPANGIIRIEDEVVTYTTATASGDNVQLNGVVRGQYNTTADAHDAGENAQLCLRYNDATVWSVVYDLLVNYGNVPASYIDYAAWAAEGAAWLQQFNVTTLITEPTGVTQLIGELAQQTLFYIWWDERLQKIGFEAVKPPTEAPIVFDDDRNILAGTTRLSEDVGARVSQVWVYYDMRSPVEDWDDSRNYRKLRIRIDDESERAEAYGDTKVKAIYSRWLQSEAQAINLSVRYLNRYRTTQRKIAFEVDAKDRGVWTSDVLDVLSRSVVDDTGEPIATRWQIISADEYMSGERIKLECQVYDYGGIVGVKYAYWMASDAPNYADRLDDNGAWFAEDDGKMPDNGMGWVYV
jgi:hypothetical protein